MPHFRVDDAFHAHRKVAKLIAADESDALALWTLAGSWCANQLTDGWLPEYVAARLDVHYAERAAKLVRVGLWEVAERDGEPGWQFHGWSEPGRNLTAEQVTAERAATAERQRRFRERVKGTGSNAVTNGVGNAGVTQAPNGAVTQPLPFPSLPFPSVTTTPSPADADDAPTSTPKRKAKPRPPITDTGAFARFWAVYPRKVNKGAAEKAWNRALAEGADPQLIVDTAALFAMERKGQDPQYTKHPATWLNGRCWEDEPDPVYKPPVIGAPTNTVTPSRNTQILEAAMRRAEEATYTPFGVTQ